MVLELDNPRKLNTDFIFCCLGTNVFKGRTDDEFIANANLAVRSNNLLLISRLFSTCSIPVFYISFSFSLHRCILPFAIHQVVENDLIFFQAIMSLKHKCYYWNIKLYKTIFKQKSFKNYSYFKIFFDIPLLLVVKTKIRKLTAFDV